MKLELNEQMPNFLFDTPYEKQIKLKSKIKNKKTMILFLRYYGCTLCQLDLMELKENYDRIKNTQGDILVVLQSDPDVLLEEMNKNGEFPFDIICDPQQRLYEEFEILPATSKLKLANGNVVKKIIKANKRGISHGKYEGNELQLPATFVVDDNLKLLYAHYGTNAADIPTIDEIEELLK